VTLRVAKVSLIFALALFYTFVVFNNVTDYNSNYQFVRHVLMMDTTFLGNRGMWRAIDNPAWHTIFYLSIIAAEIATMLLFWWGGWSLAKQLRATAAAFHAAKSVAIVACTLSLSMWMVAFLSIGGEWFLMWQSKVWNGQEEAFRMFAVVSLVLLFVTQPDVESQP
jgi:predicted small integral membrane protein